MVILSRILAFLLIIAIVWVGFIQLTYVKDVNKIKENYGPYGYCYMCGQETLKQCECQYFPKEQLKGDGFKLIQKQISEYNAKICPLNKPDVIYYNALENLSI